MKTIWWLASYPKSGNTWFRAFLTSLMKRDLEGSLLDHLGGGPIASAREVFEFETGVESDELRTDEVQRIRPDVYRSFATRSTDPLYLKAHDARIDPVRDLCLIPSDATAGAVYIIRNPLDVAVSSAHFNGCDTSKATKNLLSKTFTIARNEVRAASQLDQVLGTWSHHVRSWTEHQDFPVLVLRYEDMLEDPTTHFSRAAAFLQIEMHAEDITRAINETRFDLLQKAEAEHGFSERSMHSKQFFRKGKAGSWREELSTECADKLVEAHGEVMRRHGYVDEYGRVVY